MKHIIYYVLYLPMLLVLCHYEQVYFAQKTGRETDRERSHNDVTMQTREHWIQWITFTAETNAAHCGVQSRLGGRTHTDAEHRNTFLLGSLGGGEGNKNYTNYERTAGTNKNYTNTNYM